MKTYHLKEPETVWAIQYDGTNSWKIWQKTRKHIDEKEKTEGGMYRVYNADETFNDIINIGDYLVKKDMTGWYVSPKDFFEQRHIEVLNED